MRKRKIGIIALLTVGFAIGISAVLWSRGTADRAQEKLELAVKYISENDYDKAVLAYNEAIKIEPKQVKAYQGLAKVYTLQRKFEEARNAYDNGVKAVSANEQNTLRLGLAGMYIDQGQLADAEKSYQEITTGNQTSLEAYWGLAMVYQKQDDNTKAEAVLRQAVAKYPDDYRSYNTLALFLQQNDKSDDAFNNLVKSLSIEINQQEAYIVLSDLYQGKWIELQKKLPEVSNQQVSAMLEFYMYYASNDYSKAMSVYTSKTSSQTGNYKTRILTAIAMYKANDGTGAQNLINQLSDEKFDDLLLSDLALYYQVAGDNDKSRLCAIKAIQADGTNLEAVALLQSINSENGKIYAAQFLLYNWKPVGTAQEELLAKSLFVPGESDNSNTLILASSGVKVVERDFIIDNGLYKVIWNTIYAKVDKSLLRPVGLTNRAKFYYLKGYEQPFKGTSEDIKKIISDLKDNERKVNVVALDKINQYEFYFSAVLPGKRCPYYLVIFLNDKHEVVGYAQGQVPYVGYIDVSDGKPFSPPDF